MSYFSTGCEIATLWRVNILTMKNCSRVVHLQSLPWGRCAWVNLHSQGSKIMSISSFYGRLRKWLSSKSFCAGTITRTSFPHWRLCSKCLHFTTTKELKLGCTLPNLANICLHKSTNAKVYPFTENDKDLFGKIRDDMVSGPSIVFTRKAVVNDTLVQDSANVCKSIVGIDASQLYPLSMCQEMPTGLYTGQDRDP